MLINENVERYRLEDWVSNVIGEYDTLDEVEEKMHLIVQRNARYKKALQELEDIENGIYEDLYVIGLDKDGNEVPVEFG